MNRRSVLTMAYRNLLRHRQKQIFLFAALLLCFALISLLTLLSAGMGRNVTDSARVHYGGDLFVIGFYGENRDRPAWIDRPRDIRTLIDDIPGLTVLRSLLFKKAYLYYNGRSQLLKNVIGLDYDKEKTVLDHYEVTEGNLEMLVDSGYVVLSSSLGEKMGLRAGDGITLKTINPSGQVNTGNFIVAALINDDTLLGYYRLFMDRRDLNRLLGWGGEDFSSLGIYLDDPQNADYWVEELHRRLERTFPTAGVVTSREDYYRETEKSWKGIRYFVYALGVYVSDVDELLRAMDLVSYFIYLMMLVITLVSVLVTYRIILHDRSRELAIFQAMGMTLRQVEVLLLTETLLLIIISLSVGTVLAFILMNGLKLLSFSGIQGFGIFLKGGKLTGEFVFSRYCFNIVVILTGVLPPVWLLVRQEISRPLAVTLKGVK